MKLNFFIFVGCLIFNFTAHAQEVSLKKFLEISWANHPLLQIEGLEKNESDQIVKSARGGYFPHLSLEAVDSKGFPSSNSDLHIGGIMGSAFHSKIAGGIVLDQIIYDFGRTSSLLEKAHAEKEVSEAKMSQDKLLFFSQLASVYLNCARVKTEIEENSYLSNLAQLILKETKKMVKTGQVSVIDSSLSQIQVNDLELHISDLKEEAKSLSTEMSAYANTTKIECSRLKKDLVTEDFSPFKTPAPDILLAKAQLNSSQSLLDNAKAKQRPTLNLTGSFGYLEEARLVPKSNYSAGVGFIFPFFNGGEDYHLQSAYKFQVDAQKQEVRAAQLEFQTHLQKMTDDIFRYQNDLKILDVNKQAAQESVDLAQKRYSSMQGHLVDVREAFRLLTSVEEQKTAALYSYILNQFEKNILDENTNK